MAGGHPVVCGWPPSCNRSWEQLYKPCPASAHQLSLSGGQRWVCGAPGLRPYTLPRQSTRGCTRAGWCSGETVPWAMLVPAWGAQQPAACGWWAERCSRMAAASSCFRSVGRRHGIAPSGQAAGEWGELFWAAQGTPAVVLSAAQSPCWGRDLSAALGSIRGGEHASHEVPSTLLPPRTQRKATSQG